MPDLFEPDVELRWRGKETKVKTVSLPFQTVERIDLGGSDWQSDLLGAVSAWLERARAVREATEVEFEQLESMSPCSCTRMKVVIH